MEDILLCPICKNPYDTGPHRPLLLPSCGHTFCSSCISTGRLQRCPEDGSNIPDYVNLPTNILALRGLESRGQQQIPGVAADVKLIRSEDVELLQKVGEGGSGQVWKALYKHKTVRLTSVLYIVCAYCFFRYWATAARGDYAVGSQDGVPASNSTE
jgi:hypothetical protein